MNSFKRFKIFFYFWKPFNTRALILFIHPGDIISKLHRHHSTIYIINVTQKTTIQRYQHMHKLCIWSKVSKSLWLFFYDFLLLCVRVSEMFFLREGKGGGGQVEKYKSWICSKCLKHFFPSANRLHRNLSILYLHPGDIISNCHPSFKLETLYHGISLFFLYFSGLLF